jgi:hypothetical protein
MSRPQGERIATLETKVDAVIARLDKHDAATSDLSRKLDQVLANQSANATATQAAISAMASEISLMKPDVKTVADAKLIWKWGRWIVGGAGVVATAIAVMKGWIIMNWEWFNSR